MLKPVWQVVPLCKAQLQDVNPSDLLNGEVFHSDFVPLEGDYDIGVLKEIASYPNSLYAVSIKGANQREFQKNTEVNLNEVLLEKNLEKLFQAKVPCYFTFTGMSEESIQEFIGNHKQYPFKDSFNIDLVQYKALDYKE